MLIADVRARPLTEDHLNTVAALMVAAKAILVVAEVRVVGSTDQATHWRATLVASAHRKAVKIERCGEPLKKIPVVTTAALMVKEVGKTWLEPNWEEERSEMVRDADRGTLEAVDSKHSVVHY